MSDQRLTGETELATELSLLDLFYLVDVSDATDNAAGSSRKIMVDRVLGYGLHSMCEGRLTLATGDAENMAGTASATTVYFTPYLGNRIALYDGTRWRLYTFAEISLALGTLTNALPYDVFIYDNAGTLTLEFLAWTSGTARATALVKQDGIWCKTGALTRRYLGTFWTISTTATEDDKANRMLWNFYNRLPYADLLIDANVSWTNAGNGTWSIVGGSAATWVRNILIGIADRVYKARAHVYAAGLYHVAINRDASSSFNNAISTMGGSNLASNASTIVAEYSETPPVGIHILYGIQTTASATTETAKGQVAPGAGTIGANSGMLVEGWR